MVGRHESSLSAVGICEPGDLSGPLIALVPVGSVEAVRQEYQLFRIAGGDYLVFSPSNRRRCPST